MTTTSSHQRLKRVREALPPGIPREPGRQAPRAGRDRWAIEAAWARDLRGDGTAKIADNLDLRDHLGVATESQDGDQSRSARRYVARGREILASLAAWPWVLVQRGRLEREWWKVDRYAGALLSWHHDWFVMAINDALLSVDCVAGEEEYRTNGERLTIAEELYRERLRAQLRDRADAA